MLCCSASAVAQATDGPPAGPVRVVGHSFVDDRGPFPGLGVSYFTALWRCKHDRARLEKDLSFLSKQGFNYYRMLSMVGYYPAWNSREVAPVAFNNKEGKRVEAWPDYWDQLRQLVDLAFDKYQLRTHITIFADAQLMPEKQARVEHMRKLLEEVVRGREQKIMLLEVANEAWQNGFPGEQGIADLREFATYLNTRTEVPVAITSNHDVDGGFEKTYAGANADLATWHFSRDRRAAAGWKPVIDCWDYAVRPGLPPVISNEPIGPGASVASEKDPIKLVMAAAFAYVAKLPSYLFHSEAGVFGRTRFEDMIAIDRFKALLRILPQDLPNWRRNDGKGPEAPLRVPEESCVMNAGSRKGNDFVCIPVGIQPGGLELEASMPARLEVFDPLTVEQLMSASLKAGERLRLPSGPGALIIIGNIESK